MYLSDVIKEYLYEIKLKNYTEGTQKGYKNNILKFSRLIESEFDESKNNSKLLKFYCNILSTLNNKTHSHYLFLSFIKNGYRISKNTTKIYNDKIIELGFID